MKFITNRALAINGDRIEKGAEVELTKDEAAIYDPADIQLIDATETEPEAIEAEVALEDMNVAQLRERAAELGLSTAGSKADLQERISLHVPATEEEVIAD